MRLHRRPVDAEAQSLPQPPPRLRRYGGGRLLQLAQDIVGSVDDLDVITTSLPLRRSVSSVGSFDADAKPASKPALPPILGSLPFKRSAHSELALTLEGTGLA